MKYNAFISYSHIADGLLASKLQLALHKIAKPWYKIRALSIYRDQTNLSVTPAFWNSIQDALGNSNYLILMASPKAAQSKWVNQEIAYWLKNKSLDTIIIVVTEGELVWNNELNRFDPDLSNAIPEVLIQSYSFEPLYVDLREIRSNVDLSLNNPLFKSKIVPIAARLHNKSVIDLLSDEVIEHQKTVRWRNSAIATLIIFLIISVSLFIYSNSQRKIANKERDIAVSRELTLSAEKNIKSDPQLSLILGYNAAQKAINIYGKLTPEIQSLLKRVIKANYNKIPLQFGETNMTGGGVESFAISPDGKKIAVGSQGDEVKIIDAKSFTTLFTLKQGWTVSIKWSSDGKYIATSGQEDDAINIWNAENGELVKEFVYINAASVDWRINTHQLAFALAKGDSSIVKVYDVDQDSLLFQIPGGRATWSHDGKKIVTGSITDTTWSIRIYDFTGHPICQQGGHSRYVNDITWRADNKMLATVSVDDQLIIWNTESCTISKIIKVDFPLTVSWSPDMKLIATGGGSESVRIFDASDNYELVDSIDYTTTLTGDKIDETSIRGYVLDVEWSTDGKTLILSDREGSITYVDARQFNIKSDSLLMTVAKSLIRRELNLAEKEEYLHTR